MIPFGCELCHLRILDEESTRTPRLGASANRLEKVRQPVDRRWNDASDLHRRTQDTSRRACQPSPASVLHAIIQHMLDFLRFLLDARLDIGLGLPILWREIVGNAFGLASMLLSARRRISTWIIGLMGNVLLFTVFLGGVFSTPQELDLWGQAARQVMFALVSLYGWRTWARNGSDEHVTGAAVEPRWATSTERMQLGGIIVVLLLIFWAALRAMGSWGPLADAWILTGSLVATLGMARGWIEFWLIWIAVDAVGVPLLVTAGYYPSALMYLVYSILCVYGLVAWIRRASQQERSTTPGRHDGPCDRHSR